MLRLPLMLAVLLSAASPNWVAAQSIPDVPPEDRVLGPDAEMRLPTSAEALAQTLRSIAHASGVLIGFETMLAPEEGTSGTEFGWWLRGKTVREALDSLIALHPGYEWRSVNGVIHVRPESAFTNRDHFLNHAAGPLAMKDALPLQATFAVHRVFVPACVIRHPIYTDQRDEFLKNEPEAMRTPVTFSFKGGTVLDLLDAVVRAHGSLYWNVTYHVPPERLHDAVPRYEYAIFAFADSPQIGGWWRMCVGQYDDQ